MSGKIVNPDEAVKLAYVSKRYFKDSVPRTEIADELGLSRFAVARMIQKALELGVVTITIDAPGPVDVDLSLRLVSRFGLQNAFVARIATDDREEIRVTLGRLAADVLSGMIAEDDIVGLTAGRTLIEMSRALGEVPSCDVVQLTGVADPVRERGTEAVNTMARRSGGAVYPLHAPFAATDAAARATIMAQPGIRPSLARLDRLTKAVVTMGAWPDDSLLHDSLEPSGEARRLIRRGVVAEIGTTLLGADGREIDLLTDRVIGIRTAQLRRVAQVIGIGGGRRKHAAIKAVLASGLLSQLITDEETARYLLA
ncbi:sugar-binding domain-containing protein [Microbacterium sp. X-17]|uniref:sugar-binding transcriptional regulator n=1 Tax=Microbacterium sp. X-17 TaxID=3144404 RepID=UPI0031F5C0A8